MKKRHLRKAGNTLRNNTLQCLHYKFINGGELHRPWNNKTGNRAAFKNITGRIRAPQIHFAGCHLQKNMDFER